jgi:hypothetical protein
MSPSPVQGVQPPVKDEETDQSISPVLKYGSELPSKVFKVFIMALLTTEEPLCNRYDGI